MGTCHMKWLAQRVEKTKRPRNVSDPTNLRNLLAHIKQLAEDGLENDPERCLREILEALQDLNRRFDG